MACKTKISFSHFEKAFFEHLVSKDVFVFLRKTHCMDSDQGSPPKNEVAGDKQALVHLGKAVTVVFTHAEVDVMSIFIT